MAKLSNHRERREGSSARDELPPKLRALLIFALPWFALFAYGTSVPTDYATEVFIGALGWIIACLWWMGLVFAARADRGRVLRAHPKSWAVFPAATLALVVGVPLHLRFLASSSALATFGERARNESAEGTREWSEAREQRIGLHSVSYAFVDTDERVVMLELPDTGWLFHSGALAYAPRGAPVDSADHYEHLWGDWYAVELD